MTIGTTDSPKIRQALQISADLMYRTLQVMVAMPGSYVPQVIQTEISIDRGCDSLRQNPTTHDLDPGRSQAHRLGVLHSFSHPAVDIWLSLLQA